MAVAKWCVLNASNQVTDVILWDNVTDPGWKPPTGTTVVAYDATLPRAPEAVTVTNERTVRSALLNAMQGNRDYRAIAAPTVLQQQAQVDSLTRQVLALERMALNQFDATN